MRKPRSTKKNIILYVEGDTEKNYFDKFKKVEKDKLQIAIEKVDNMGGGGYSNFVKNLKKKSIEYGYLAIFIIIDLDKAEQLGEKDRLNELIDYCRQKNKQKSIPHFLIGTKEDFEYFACCHCSEYKDSDCKNFIKTSKLPYKSVDELKSDADIFNVLNKENRSYNVAIKKISKRHKKTYIFNDYTFKEKTMELKVKKIDILEEALTYKHSNINQLFEIVIS